MSGKESNVFGYMNTSLGDNYTCKWSDLSVTDIFLHLVAADQHEEPLQRAPISILRDLFPWLFSFSKKKCHKHMSLLLESPSLTLSLYSHKTASGFSSKWLRTLGIGQAFIEKYFLKNSFFFLLILMFYLWLYWEWHHSSSLSKRRTLSEPTELCTYLPTIQKEACVAKKSTHVSA